MALLAGKIFQKIAGNSVKMSSFQFTTLTSAEFMKNPTNEPVLEYRKGSTERKALEEALAKYSNTTTEVPIVIGGKELKSTQVKFQVMPHDHKRQLAKFYYATKEQVAEAIESALEARKDWEKKPFGERAAVLLKAADLCAGKYRMDLNAVTMLGQAKTIIQAEVDAACELVDFFRFNSYFASQLQNYQPISSPPTTNRLIYRPLEGFIAAVSPFNFTAIGGNLSSAPALMGNVVVWKPSDTAMLSNYVAFQALREAGMPDGVINFVPADGPVFGDTVTASPHLAGINFTGSVPTFRHLWKQVGQNLDIYKGFPRLVGECGGKNFHFIHPTADLDSVAAGTIRSVFEYQGQKCSACGRAFVPQSLWPQLKDKLLAIRDKIKVGNPEDGETFISAVIDEKAFKRIKAYIDEAKSGAGGSKIVAGGNCDDSKGYFIEPTIIQVTDPQAKIMTEEIFGPVLPVYAYPDQECDQLLTKLKDFTPYGLTGAVFAQDKQFLEKAKEVLKDAVGNLYLNDKSTGSIVGQQPFGGARLSGTNDKAGGPHYALKWASPQTIKETSAPITEWKYPYME